MTRIIVSGILGRMGGAIAQLIQKNNAAQLVGGVDKESTEVLSIPVFSSFDEINIEFDVIVDFSAPILTEKLVDYAMHKKCAVVVCTTGLSVELIEKLGELSKRNAVFRSANMSFGVNLMAELVKSAYKNLLSGFDIEIVERHHCAKVDAPSGTALLLADAINSEAAEKFDYCYDRSARRCARPKNEIGIHAVRGGGIVGEHEVIFAGENEILTISHSATSREVFAAGAVKAAIFLNDKKAGMYTMQNLMVQ